LVLVARGLGRFRSQTSAPRFSPSLLFVISNYFADDLLRWTSAIHPKVFDLHLFSFDASLHVQIPFLVGQAFALWPALRVVAFLFYIGLPIPIALIYAGRVLRAREKAIPSFIAFLATGPVGVLFYNLLPALGPVHIFGRAFPWQPLSTAQAAKLFLTDRGCGRASRFHRCTS
jgi:hypothetical protein